MAYIPVVMNVGTAASVNTSSPTSPTTINQYASTSDKILVIWRSAYGQDGVLGSVSGDLLSSSMTNCGIGTIRYYTGFPKLWFCWVTPTAANWSIDFEEKFIYNVPFGGGVITTYVKQRLSQGSSSTIPTSTLDTTDIKTQFNNGTTPASGVALSNYYEGGQYVNNTHINSTIPESGVVAMSNFSGSTRHASYEDGGMDKFSSIVFTAGISGSTNAVWVGYPLYTTLYYFAYDIGWTTAAAFGLSADQGSVNDSAKFSGLGGFDNNPNPTRNIPTILTRVSSYSSTNNYITHGSNQLHLRFHQDEAVDASPVATGFEGMGRTTSGSSTGSNSVAGWHNLFIVNTDNSADNYDMYDIDAATVNNYSPSNGSTIVPADWTDNDFTELTWPTTVARQQFTSGDEYIAVFLDFGE